MGTNDLPFVRKNWLNGCGQRLKELGFETLTLFTLAFEHCPSSAPEFKFVVIMSK